MQKDASTFIKFAFWGKVVASKSPIFLIPEKLDNVHLHFYFYSFLHLFLDENLNNNTIMWIHQGQQKDNVTLSLKLKLSLTTVIGAWFCATFEVTFFWFDIDLVLRNIEVLKWSGYIVISSFFHANAISLKLYINSGDLNCTCKDTPHVKTENCYLLQIIDSLQKGLKLH
jgi:hypothetical protein